MNKETSITHPENVAEGMELTGAEIVVRALKAHPGCSGRIGAVGFCIGGHLAFRAALHPEIRATCCFYPTDIHSGTLGEGKKADTLARIGEIDAEIVMIWGRQDPHIPDEGRAAIYRALLDAGRVFSWHEFNAQHAFMRDEGPRYDPEATDEAFGEMIRFFRRVLA